MAGEREALEIGHQDAGPEPGENARYLLRGIGAYIGCSKPGVRAFVTSSI